MPTPVPTKRSTRTNAGAAKRPVAVDLARPDAPTEVPPPALSPASIAEELRQTTLRAHKAIQRSPRDLHALRGLLFEIVALEDQAERLELWGLHPFLDSLRLKVEDAL
jgi:hypothetical protein